MRNFFAFFIIIDNFYSTLYNNLYFFTKWMGACYMTKRFRSIRYKFIAVMISIFLLFVVIVLKIWHYELKLEAENSAIKNMERMLHVSNTTFENQLKDIINVTSLTTVRSSNYLSTNIINIMSRDDLTGEESSPIEKLQRIT